MKAQIVSFHCVLKNRLGQVLSSSFNRDVINQLEDSSSNEGIPRLRGLVARIQNVRQGEKRQFTVPASEAYGPYDPNLVLNIPRKNLSNGDQLGIGSEIVSHAGPSGPTQVYRVVQIQGDRLILDGNHLLAGHDLVFDIEVVSARDACAEDFGEPCAPEPGAYVH
ncbi:MAG: FKBP-type peptidyl-prolyl cis-trans isomerase [Oligoflexia bacterium]|nr:FKBP-type peptidyl-prolyl cis-trans isomerase [Oligoflexia bacterium]